MFLDRQCNGDTALRHAVDEQLRAPASPVPGPAARMIAEALDPATPTESENDPWLGATISHFEILERIGLGGMSEVYRARDTALDRTVALKFLQWSLCRDAGTKARFIQEARAVSALDHANITTIHEIGETPDGQLFIAMAFHTGETLREQIAHGPLPCDRALDLTEQIASALAAAHAHGIVHRDIKPGNVMVTKDGAAKLLDFGIAKLSEGVSLTQPGTIVGTAPYMSPEQARGQAVDHRTDIWSLGVVLYEMLTGLRPFRGVHIQSIARAILEDDPEPPRHLRADIPGGMAGILEGCLVKDPAQRYQSAGDLIEDLRRIREGLLPARRRHSGIWARERSRRRLIALVTAVVLSAAGAVAVFRQFRPEPAGASARADSLAVLPFVNLSADPDQEYLAAGMHDGLIAELAKIDSLRVISRTSMMRYRDTTKSVPDIARELKVGAIIEGSARRAGNEVRVTVQLIDGTTDEHLWAETYERDFTDSLQLLDELAGSIARKVNVTLTPADERRLATSRRVNPEVYDAYLKGMYLLHLATPDGVERGMHFLEEAVRIDPDDALAHAGLSHGYSLLTSHMTNPPPDAARRSKEEALRSLELDDSIADAHAALAEIALYSDWDWSAAERYFRRAIELNPTLASAHANYAFLHNILRRQDEAIAEIDRAIQVDPLTPLWRSWRGELEIWKLGEQDADTAMRYARLALELNPEFSWGFATLGSAYNLKGMHAEAITAHEKAAALDHRWFGLLGSTYALAGRTEEARKIAAEIEAESPTGCEVDLVQVYSSLGDKEAAMRWAELAYEHRHAWTPWLWTAHFIPIHDDPRFADLMRRLKLPWPEGAVAVDANPNGA